MIRRAIPFIAAVTVASSAGATESVLAAGRIEFREPSGSCSGALVAPGVVATAAHCTPNIDQATGLPDIVFRAGNGADIARVLRAKRHPLYDPNLERVEWKFRFDIGVVALAGVGLPGIEPFPLGDDANAGETLFIVSWRMDDSARPRQRACPVLSVGTEGLVTLGCAVQGGESGAPVLRKTEDGLELVAIISSRSNILDQPVAQASNVRLRLPPLLDMIGKESRP